MAVLAALVFFGMQREGTPGEAASALNDTEALVERVGSGAEGKTSYDAHRPKADAYVYTWHRFTTADGLPSNKVMAVHTDKDRVWIGTNEGLVLYENGKFRTFTEKDGMPHHVVIALEVDERTGDLWVGTVRGLSRFSAGRFENFDQLNSGLSNDMIYAVRVDGSEVWIATANGVSRFKPNTGQWSIFNETNAPMHEPWTYAIAPAGDLVYVGAWGGGVLEFNKKTEHWKDYVDPDGEMEIDLFPDDGVVHDIISSTDYADGTLWAATYFGLSLFDGTRWKGYFDHDSGLASNFINYVKANGPTGWLCTDKGLSSFDGAAWRTYTRTREGRGQILITDAKGQNRKTVSTSTGIAHNYVLGIDFQEDEIWLATEDGLSRGAPDRKAATLVSAAQ